MSQRINYTHKAQPDFIDYLLSHSDTIPLLDRSFSESDLSPSLLREQGIDSLLDDEPSEDEAYCRQVETSDRFYTSH